jgi:hypothetical protein
MAAAVNVRCNNPPCLWVGRVRPVLVDVIGPWTAWAARVR